MKNFSEITDIHHNLDCELTLRSEYTDVAPSVTVTHNNFVLHMGKIEDTLKLTWAENLTNTWNIKVHCTSMSEQDHKSAVIVEQITVDNIKLIPTYYYNYVARRPPLPEVNSSTVLKSSGVWSMRFNIPFYQWLHQVSDQGWLFYQNNPL